MSAIRMRARDADGASVVRADGAPPTRTEQKERTRQLLVETAMRLMAERGLLGTRTLDVASEAGVAHGTLFAHFPTRDALLRAVIEALGTTIARRLHDLAERGRTLREVLAAHVEALSECEPLYARLVLEGRSLPPSARTALISIQSAISFHITQAAERELARGTLRPVAEHLLFNTWIGLVHHYVINADLFAPGERSVLAKQGATLIDHFCSLVDSGPPTSRGGRTTKEE